MFEDEENNGHFIRYCGYIAIEKNRYTTNIIKKYFLIVNKYIFIKKT